MTKIIETVVLSQFLSWIGTTGKFKVFHSKLNQCISVMGVKMHLYSAGHLQCFLSTAHTYKDTQGCRLVDNVKFSVFPKGTLTCS